MTPRPGSRWKSAACAAEALLAQGGARTVGYLGANTPALPVALFGAAIAGRPFAPLNYRLADPALRALATRLAPALVVADDGMAGRLEGLPGVTVLPRSALMALPPAETDPIRPAEAWERASADPALPAEGTDTAILLFTSGTTGAPKAALLTHANLTAYVMGRVDFASAGAEEANLVSVPPYHIAGISALLSSLWAGRRIVQLPAFEPQEWVDTAARHRVTHAMLVPTMLARLLDMLPATGLPALRALASGGGRMPRPLIERALQALPRVAFINAYGLTETSSTICLLGPEDHAAARNGDPAALARLESVGRPLPGIELAIRDPSGRPCSPGTPGEVWVRGDQVSGRYEAAEGLAARGDGAGQPTRRLLRGPDDDARARANRGRAASEVVTVALDDDALARGGRAGPAWPLAPARQDDPARAGDGRATAGPCTAAGDALRNPPGMPAAPAALHPGPAGDRPPPGSGDPPSHAGDAGQGPAASGQATGPANRAPEPPSPAAADRQSPFAPGAGGGDRSFPDGPTSACGALGREVPALPISLDSAPADGRPARAPVTEGKDRSSPDSAGWTDSTPGREAPALLHSPGPTVADMRAVHASEREGGGPILSPDPPAADGWFPTRDRGWLDDAGYLFLDGRLDDVIVRGGENISPGEVEDALRSHPAVADAAVIGLPDAQWGEKVVAVVVPAPGAAPGPEELRAHVRRLLRSTRVPETIHLREALPYTETGKLLRRVLRDDLSGA